MPKKGKAKAKVPSAKDIGALIQAALSGETKNVLAMLKSGIAIETQDAQGNHALGAACCGGHLELVEQLLALGAPLEVKNQIGDAELARVDGIVQTLRYDSKSCRLFIFFNLSKSKKRVEHFEFRDLYGELLDSKQSLEVCYKEYNLIT